MPARRAVSRVRTEREWERLVGWSGKAHRVGRSRVLPKITETNLEYEQRMKGLGRRLKRLVGGFTAKELAAANIGDLLQRIRFQEARQFGKSNEWPELLDSVERSKRYTRENKPYVRAIGLDGDFVVFTGAGGEMGLKAVEKDFRAIADGAGLKKVVYWGDAREAVPRLLVEFGLRLITAYAAERKLDFNEYVARSAAEWAGREFAAPERKFTQYAFAQAVLESYQLSLRRLRRNTEN